MCITNTRAVRQGSTSPRLDSTGKKLPTPPTSQQQSPYGFVAASSTHDAFEQPPLNNQQQPPAPLPILPQPSCLGFDKFMAKAE